MSHPILKNCFKQIKKKILTCTGLIVALIAPNKTPSILGKDKNTQTLCKLYTVKDT